MNDHTPDRSRSGPRQRPTTQAAEGIPRLKWTLEEFERLGELGIFTEDDRMELIGGELVPMSPKGNRHEVVKSALIDWFSRRLPLDAKFTVEPGWRPGGDAYHEPDILVYPAAASPVTVTGHNVVLLIEIADTGLKFDTGRKALAYAVLGVRDYWVINALTLEARIFRGPSDMGYALSLKLDPDELLSPLLLPGLDLKLSGLDLAE